ncbi:nucleoside deaminase [Ulvibacterium marinum]|uniref:Nucleoside deaminase n=1 Tax=Ulvibacterium marinum TaxID=2419782 RepID=A0A3B0C048_9FLAO|nr:nucleoside deaminase [Ulvibacterium marinum]RKN78740.1 nucleoside deaminase [Ulvibacterium marinum]
MNEHHMSLAIEKAIQGRDADGGGAFGAVIVRNDEIVCKVHNLVKGKDDLTQHAELLAIQIACQTIGKDNLKECILYTSCEPCMMCLGACHWAKFKAIYYGTSAEDAQQHGFTYSKSYLDMDSTARRSEFKMTQLLRTEALEVWTKS